MSWKNVLKKINVKNQLMSLAKDGTLAGCDHVTVGKQIAKGQSITVHHKHNSRVHRTEYAPSG